MFYLIFWATVILFLSASVFSVLSLKTDEDRYFPAVKYIFFAALPIELCLGFARVYYSPGSGFESIVSSIWGFFYMLALSLTLLLFYLFFSKWKNQWKSFIVIILPFITMILIVSAPFIESPRKVMLNAENMVVMNHFVTAHIFFTVAGELFFFLSFVGSILYIAMEIQLRKKTSMKLMYKLPNLESVEKFNSWSITRSLYLLSIGIILGLTMTMMAYNTVFLGTAKEAHIFFSWAVIFGIFILRRLKKIVSHKINIINLGMFIIIMSLFIFTNIFITKGFHGFK